MDLESRTEVLERAEIVSREIEYTLAAFDPLSTTDLIPPSTPPTIDDCQFEDWIEDPFEIVRYVKGEEAAQRLEYEGDLEFTLAEIQSCCEILTNNNTPTDNNDHRHAAADGSTSSSQ